MSVFLIQYKCLLLMSYALLKQLVLILTKVDLGFDGADSIWSLRATPRASVNSNLYI